MKRIISAGIVALVAGVGFGPVYGAAPEEAMKSAGCLACHAPERKMVGPSFKDIAAKYKGQDVTAQLIEKVRKGGSGVFGPIPMAPNPPAKISDADLKASVEHILSF